jgi:hypothetical protein
MTDYQGPIVTRYARIISCLVYLKYGFIHLSSGRMGLIAATRLRPALYATFLLNFKIGPALAKAAYLPSAGRCGYW